MKYKETLYQCDEFVSEHNALNCTFRLYNDELRKCKLLTFKSNKYYQIVAGTENEKIENSVFIGPVNIHVRKTTCNTAQRHNKKLMLSISEARTTTANGEHILAAN